MSQQNLFTIEYKLHGAPKKLTVRAARMSTEDAWQWAGCDAGATPIPKPGKPPLKLFSRPMAEKYGITDVQWR
ncbi:hypothetical protein SAMN04490203_2131 [Pseudomonas taetrolens]|uniref:Uncharacterized protein n=1 Tax=Pseudomonas taetrolens TaxID=47884 RepID=A0A0J6GTM3_PSETA|nr:MULTISPECIES: DUF6555 family protein [Pseudomonas]KMM85454.1 hypothetical protein TU78_08900 [Pseudomonas taetrolens]MBW0236265.1 hypothetical protein [Pseudomonas sp. D1HM]SEC28497.1 hypothetical protein SAMN04490203_2131 [Pseudomonas taetrolens]SQF86284.1 Uncharacterised protein [Pseudomonas taetrolens]VEH49361.1 Uncharacterised protein [Pseudomonas taetrolens]